MALDCNAHGLFHLIMATHATEIYGPGAVNRLISVVNLDSPIAGLVQGDKDLTQFSKLYQMARTSCVQGGSPAVDVRSDIIMFITKFNDNFSDYKENLLRQVAGRNEEVYLNTIAEAVKEAMAWQPREGTMTHQAYKTSSLKKDDEGRHVRKGGAYSGSRNEFSKTEKTFMQLKEERLQAWQNSA